MAGVRGEISSGGASGRNAPSRHELSGANDDKIRRIASLIDRMDHGEANQAVLDPIRARLGLLSLPRPLKLRRLLFIPFDPVIVAAKHWETNQPTVPRSALTVIAGLVMADIGDDGMLVKKMIAGHDVTQLDIIAGAGSLLWARAAKIAAVAHVPSDWAHTGLPTTAFLPLIQAMATVWQRATRLRNLFRGGEIGALKANAAEVTAILTGAPGESVLGCGMIARLILAQSPFAAEHLRLFASAGTSTPEAIVLRKSVIGAVANAADQLEHDIGLADGLRVASLDQACDRVLQITRLLLEMEQHAGHRISAPRLKHIRDNLSRACLDRFTVGMRAELIGPLQGRVEPIDTAEQHRLEARARDLRTLESTARRLDPGQKYEAMLRAGSEAVAAARRDGIVSRQGEIRLTEILAGTEAALRLYRLAPPAS